MTAALVIKRGQHIQCFCGKIECYVIKPTSSNFIQKKERMTVYNNVCKFDNNLSYISDDEFVVLYNDCGKVYDVSTRFDANEITNIPLKKIINMLIHKNKSWIYSYLHEKLTLYTSRIPGDVLYLILEYVSHY